MSDTPLLGLPYLAQAQAQKHVTHNEALTILDGLVQGAAKSRQLAVPPVAPVNGDRYLVAAEPTGDWLAAAGKLALFNDGGWRFFAPREGWQLWIEDEDVMLVFDGMAWRAAGGAPTGAQAFERVGINATADATNRLAVSSAATLLNHEGQGHQLKVNKAAAPDTASLLFQTAYSGRAEMGTTGSDDFRIKVSPDGSTFFDALSAEAATGKLTAHQSLCLAPRNADPAAPQDGEVWYSIAGNKFRKRENGVTSDLVPPAGSSGSGAVGNVSVVTAGLAADLTMLQPNTFYDGPQVELGPGTWLIFALGFFMRTSPNASMVGMRVTDGVNSYAMTSQSMPPTSSWVVPFPLNTVLTLSAGTIVKMQMIVTMGSTAIMKGGGAVNSFASPKSTITAVRIA